MARLLGIVVLALVGSAGSLDRCYGYEDNLLLMPDKSGKIDLVMSEKSSETSLDKSKAGILELAEDTRGFVAFSSPTVELKDGWWLVRCTIYFEDINLLNYSDNRKCKNKPTEHGDCIHFQFDASPDTKEFTLHIEDWIFSKMPGGPGVTTWEEIKKDSENVVKRRVTVPGKVKMRVGFQQSDGRVVTYERSPRTIKKFRDSAEFPVAGYRRITYVGSEVTDAELAAFKKELAAAKVAWPKIRDDLEAARRKKEAEKK